MTSGKLVVIPHCNRRAIERNERGVNYDLNRQFPPEEGTECLTELAAAIWNEAEEHDPDWAFDLHSSYDMYGDGVAVGQAVFPTYVDPARTYGENTVAALNDRFGLAGDCDYQMGNTVDADRDMLMHRLAGLLDCPGYICEVAENCGESLERRVRWHLFTVEHVMNQYGQRRVEPSGSPARLESVGSPTRLESTDSPARLESTDSSARLEFGATGGTSGRAGAWGETDGPDTSAADGLVSTVVEALSRFSGGDWFWSP